MTATLDQQRDQLQTTDPEVKLRFELSIWRSTDRYEIPWTDEPDPMIGTTIAVIARALWLRHDGKRTVEAWDVTNPDQPSLVIAWTGMHDASTYSRACAFGALGGTPMRGWYAGGPESFQQFSPAHRRTIDRIGFAKERRSGTGRYDPNAVSAVDKMAREFAPALEAELRTWRVAPTS